jgi:hypothetical protein
MIHSAHSKSDETRVAELKRLIKSRQFDSLEMLENAVDDFLWGESPLSDAPVIREQMSSAGHETSSAG